MSSIFLSHTHADKPFVRRLALDLQAAGVRVWLDEAELMIGDSLIEKIRQGIDEMEYLGVILSPNSVKSPWVQREVDVAMNQEIEGKRVKVLPFFIEDCELPGFLKGKLYADFRVPERYRDELEKILHRLGTETSGEPIYPENLHKQSGNTSYNTTIIRELLIEGLSDTELSELCFDYFRAVYEYFSVGMSKRDKVQQLLDYAARNNKLQELQIYIKRKNPCKFNNVSSRKKCKG